jgi:probable HAF family extracellular repeat protein
MIGLGFFPAGGSSIANGVSGDGSVVVGGGATAVNGVGVQLAFRWTASAGMVALGSLPGNYDSIANAVSADGTVAVGSANCTNASQCLSNPLAFRWTAASGMVGLGVLPGYGNSQAFAASADGSVVVGSSQNTTNAQTQAFRWTVANGMVGLGFLPGDTYSAANATNADGSVVVGNGSNGPFRWTAATGMQSLQALLTASGVNLSGWTLSEATGVSADGTVIVGFGIDPSGQNQGWIAYLPPLQISPTTGIVASGPQGGPFSPLSFSYTLSATSGSINFLISGAPNWLTPSSTSGTASAGTTVTFTVNANANSPAVGTYGPTTITFTDSETGGRQTRTATLTVNPPALQVSPATNIAASGTQSGPFLPSSFHYTLSATYGSVNYSIITPSWLTTSPESGTVTTTGKSIIFTVNSNAHGLNPDTYVNSINFYNTTNSQGNTTRLATLTVVPKQYTITVRASPSADGTVSGSGTFAGGSLRTVTATPNGNHTFVHWTENAKVVSTSESYMFTLNGNVTLVADFR